MARKTRGSRSRVAIDTVPTPELENMKLVPARLTKARGTYSLVIGRQKQQIPRGPLTLEADLDALLDAPVTAVLSRKRKDEIVAIGTWPTPEKPRIKPRITLCYVPAERTLQRVRAKYRDAIVEELVADGSITEDLAALLRVE